MKTDELIERIIKLAIEEDLSTGDITTLSLIPTNSKAIATLKAKSAGVVSGLQIAKRVFEHFDSQVVFKSYLKDGSTVKSGEIIAHVEGAYGALLSAERTALNFLQRMSGIATNTARYVEKLKGSNAQLLDTRKTAPGMRATDKLAVLHGGGVNHRFGLFDMVLIKDNHIKVAGSISKAVEQVRERWGNKYKIEVEASNLDQVKEAVESRADIIMLDNMSNSAMSEAVAIVAGRAKTEASGNMELDRIEGVALTGVDFISVGALTHSVTALDISMNIE